jgi:flagellar hook-basal body complex protein FliE
MSESISSILQQIRSYQSQASERGTGLNLEPIASPASLDTAKPAQAGSSFTDTLRDAISGVNDAQKNAGNLAQAFELGDPAPVWPA